MEEKANELATVEKDAHVTSKEDKPKYPKNASPSLESGLRELVSGRASLVVGDISAAVDSLASACEALDAHYGEGAKECSDAYFFYGKALLEMARVEDGVLENVLDANDDDDEEEEEEEEEDEEEDKEDDDDAKDETKDGDEESKDDGETEESVPVETNEENGESKTVTKDGESKEGSRKDEEGGEKNDREKDHAENKEHDDKDGENESIGSNEAGTSKSKDCNDKRTVENEDVDDLPNVQLSWEMLELAKMGYTKTIEETRDHEKLVVLNDKLSETYQLLGEVSIEGENYPQALEDLSMCLDRRSRMLPTDSRAIAETHYQLGLALSFASHFDRSVVAFTEAINVLRKRVNNLKENKVSHDPAKKVDEFYSASKEMSDIESLIPLIEEKITETEEMKVETERKAKLSMGNEEREDDEFNSKEKAGKSNNLNLVKKTSKKSDSAKCVEAMDISHMVRKRKAELESNGDEEMKSKRQHIDNDEQKE